MFVGGHGWHLDWLPLVVRFSCLCGRSACEECGELPPGRRAVMRASNRKAMRTCGLVSCLVETLPDDRART